jgi:hypothetical protein
MQANRANRVHGLWMALAACWLVGWALLGVYFAMAAVQVGLDTAWSTAAFGVVAFGIGIAPCALIAAINRRGR